MTITKKSIFSISLLVILVCAGVQSTQAQCLENLRRARGLYNEGKLNLIYGELQSCVGKESDLNDEEKTEAYRLIILSYIFQDQPDLADQAMLELLKVNPLYETDDATDPNELIILYSAFRTNPIYRIGLRFGGNYTFTNVTGVISNISSDQSNGVYGSNVNIGGAGFIEHDFFQNRITLRSEITWSSYILNYSATSFPSNGYLHPTYERGTPIVTNTFKETQNWIGLSVLGRYTFLKGVKFQPYLIAGPSFQSLMSSSAGNETSIPRSETATGANLDYKEDGLRKRINISAIGGIGILYPIGKSSLLLEATYQYGFSEITDKHTSSELTWLYGAAVSNKTISVVNFTAGFMLNHYSPKKLTN